MRPVRPPEAIAQAAAFALFESLRHAAPLALGGPERLALAFEAPEAPASAGLAFCEDADEGLRLRLGAHALWVAARVEAQGPHLAFFWTPDRPTLALRFWGGQFAATPAGWVLRERATFSSHDGRQGEREALVAALAAAYGMPMEGPWLVLGTWNDAEGAWDPEAARRTAAAAVVLEAARRLRADWACP